MGNRAFVLSMFLHAADIGHASRTWEVTHQWTGRISNEFFNQGDKERSAGLEVSFI